MSSRVPSERLWSKFMTWRIKLAAKQAEMGMPLHEAFFYVHSPSTPANFETLTFVLYEFFRDYHSLPAEKQQQLRELAEEAAKITDMMAEEA